MISACYAPHTPRCSMVHALHARIFLRRSLSARRPARRGGPRALMALARARRCCPDRQRAFLDIDSLLRPVYGHHKQGASFGHAKIASRALLRLGLSPQITTLSTATAPP